MKLHPLLASVAALLALSLTGLAHAAKDNHDHAHSHAPLHGGVVVEVKDVDYEFVAKPDVLALHVRDHGKPVALPKGAIAKITLLTAGQKQQAELKPEGSALQAKGNFNIAAGTQAVAQVTLSGAPVMVRFVLK